MYMCIFTRKELIKVSKVSSIFILFFYSPRFFLIIYCVLCSIHGVLRETLNNISFIIFFFIFVFMSLFIINDVIYNLLLIFFSVPFVSLIYLNFVSRICRHTFNVHIFLQRNITFHLITTLHSYTIFHF